MIMKFLLFYLLLFPLAASVEAGNEKQILELESVIMQQQQEQQILFQQFQMLQELRRNEMAQMEQTQPAVGDIIINGEAPRYEDIARQRKGHTEKIDRYTTELHELYTRYREAENERRALIEQLDGLKPGTVMEQKK